MGFPGYFLIVADFIKWAKERDIPVGPGRGSGAGSLVAYALTITDLDPLRYGLLFERFLNPDRISMPDFDIDFCMDRREEVIAYVQERYGRDRVAQIITFGALLSKAAVRDVGRVLQMPYGQVDRLSKLIPIEGVKPVSIEKALADEPRLREEARRDPQVARLLEIAGADRGAAAQRLDPRRRRRDRRPAARRAGAALPRPALGHAGDPVQHEVGRGGGAGEVRLPRPEDPDGHPERPRPPARPRRRASTSAPSRSTTPQTYELYASRRRRSRSSRWNRTGMRTALRQLKPTCIEDIIALVALYRPGPMENIPKFCNVKNGRETRESAAPLDRPDPRRDPGHHRLPGAGDGDRPQAGGLLASAAPTCCAARWARRSRPRWTRRSRCSSTGAKAERRLQGQGRGGLEPARQVRQLRLQQVARRRLRRGQLPDRLAQGQPPGRVHGRGDELRHPPHRQARPLQAGGRPPRHRGGAALRQPLRARPSPSPRAASSTPSAR